MLGTVTRDRNVERGRAGTYLRRGTATALVAFLALALSACGLIDSVRETALKPVGFEIVLHNPSTFAMMGAEQLPLPRVELLVLACEDVTPCKTPEAPAVKFEEIGIPGRYEVKPADPGEPCEDGSYEDCKLFLTQERQSLTVWLPDGEYAIATEAFAPLAGGFTTEYCAPSENVSVGAGPTPKVVIQLEPCFTGRYVYFDSEPDEADDTFPQGTSKNPYDSLQDAMAAALEGGTVYVLPGVHEVEGEAGRVNVNKSITLAGYEGEGESSVFRITGPIGSGSNSNFLALNANGIVIEHLTFEVTEEAGNLEGALQVAGDEIIIRDNVFRGTYEDGSDEVTRAVVTTSDAQDLLISNNVIHDLRQPAYFNPSSTGSIVDNVVYRTKGWVVVGASFVFEGNVWNEAGDPEGDSENYGCDITLAEGTTSDWPYESIDDLSAANSGANVCDQRSAAPGSPGRAEGPEA